LPTGYRRAYASILCNEVIAQNFPRALLNCSLIGKCQWHLFILYCWQCYRISPHSWSIFI
jgi:hypothetical protein